MPLVRKEWITRQDLRGNPEAVFVFGDNVERNGFGGQAKEMRGEPNAIGVATKWKPSMSAAAFFDDSIECQVIVMQDLQKVQAALDAGLTVYVPKDGIGTGLSRLFATAPKLDRFIKRWFEDREKPIGLGRCPTCGEPGHMMEKCPNGNTICIDGHTHPSSDFRQ